MPASLTGKSLPFLVRYVLSSVPCHFNLLKILEFGGVSFVYVTPASAICSYASKFVGKVIFLNVAFK